MAETETQESFPLLSYILHKVNPSSHSPPPHTQLQDLMKQYPLLQNSKLVSSLANNIPITAAQSYTMLMSKTTEFEDGEVERMKGELKQVEKKLVLAYGCAMDEFESKEDEDEEEGEGVEKVDLSGKELSFVPDKIGRFLGLVVLNLSGNQFKVIPNTITGLGKLEELDVSSNLLESLPDSIGLLLNLRILNVSGNKLIALPQSICLCSLLVELDASFNSLRSLPANIGYNLGKLERLYLHLNKISSLPPSLGEMNSLRYLDIHFNELRGVPNAIGRLTNLEVLNLSSNFSDLTELPETIGDLINLRELDLSNNQLRTLPSTFHWLINLTTLNVEENPLEFPPMDVVREGVKAIKDYMSKMWDDRIAEEQNMILEANQQEHQDGWLAWGSSLLSSIVSSVSTSVLGYSGSGKETTKSSWLDQQL